MSNYKKTCQEKIFLYVSNFLDIELNNFDNFKSKIKDHRPTKIPQENYSHLIFFISLVE
jgi:hypothetical protein